MPTHTNGHYIGHLSEQQLARVEALHVARGVLQSTGFLTSAVGAAPDGLIDVAEYVVHGVTETVHDAIATVEQTGDKLGDDDLIPE